MRLFKKIVIYVSFVASYGCTQTHKDTKVDRVIYSSSDSSELLTLTKKILKWHEADLGVDFPLLSNNDSVYSGIDWTAHKVRMEELSKTQLFTKEFINNYQGIALQLDKELKQNQIKYYKGELPPYGNDANEWCDCQDYPSDIWERLMINNIKMQNNIASYYWTWGDKSNYFVKARKEDGGWKIEYLERFDVKNYTW